MAQRTGFSDPDRHLSRRNGYYTYKRRVPAKVAALDSRAPTIRIALGTRDLGEARVKRDAHERADDELWASFCADGDHAAALARHNAVVARAAALGFTYRHLSSILAEESASAILSRLRALQDAKAASVEETAILGGIASPRVSLSRALDEFVTVIVADELRGKSPAQYRLWLAERKRAIKNFEAVCGPRNIHDITRQDAILFYEWWQHKIAPARGTDGETVTPTHSPSSGNHDLRVLRVLYRRYFIHKGGDAKEIRNPFDNLSFAEEKVGEDEKKRRPFTTDWIQNVILVPGALAGLNEEARAIVLTLVETGCRPGEVGNLLPERIMLSDAVPHIAIKPSRDPRAPRQIKTKSAIRRIPLVGVALEAMRKFPNGFPRYRDKSNSLSAVLGKFFRENGLFPTDEHVIYSFRHSFEDRMKEGHVDAELRKILMGHTIDRPDYGDKGGMAWRRDSLARIALPFDPAIV